MAEQLRNFYINGELLVSVKGRSDSLLLGDEAGIAEDDVAELGLTSDPVVVKMDYFHEELKVNAWGQNTPEVQVMGASCNILMQLVHFDSDVLEAVIRESLGGAPQFGQLSWAGATLGNGKVFGASGGLYGNHYISLNLTAQENPDRPYHFPYTYLQTPPFEFPLSTTKSILNLNFRAIAYVTDPYFFRTANGIEIIGAYGAQLLDRNLDGDIRLPEHDTS